MSFVEFVRAYNETIERTRKGLNDPSDFQDTSITLTNPGTVGTISSIPRLMKNQGAVSTWADDRLALNEHLPIGRPNQSIDYG
jgi:pyruvate/2-oxoglutarate dehydrogenase complex dihydrolipoamide acyltransferase (E2) component